MGTFFVKKSIIKGVVRKWCQLKNMSCPELKNEDPVKYKTHKNYKTYNRIQKILFYNGFLRFKS